MVARLLPTHPPPPEKSVCWAKRGFQHKSWFREEEAQPGPVVPARAQRSPPCRLPSQAHSVPPYLSGNHEIWRCPRCHQSSRRETAPRPRNLVETGERLVTAGPGQGEGLEGKTPAGDPTEVVDVGRHPPAVGQLLQVIGRLVVPANEHREDRGLLLAGVVPAGTGLQL